MSLYILYHLFFTFDFILLVFLVDQIDVKSTLVMTLGFLNTIDFPSTEGYGPNFMRIKPGLSLQDPSTSF